MKKLIALSLVVLSILSVGCEQDIDLKLPDFESKIVIEGSVSDLPGPYFVKISRTVSYLGDDTIPMVSGATIVINDDAGNSDTLSQVSPGLYQTQSLQGVIGRSYTMTAVVDGVTYTGTDKMNRVNPVDSLTMEYLSNLVFLDDGFYITAYATEPAGLGDFFKFNYYKNDSLYDGLDALFFSDDKTVDGNHAEIFFPFTQQSGDTVKIEIVSLSNSAYDYYLTLQSLLNSGGSPFGSPPQNVYTNLSNGALGFFQANGIESAQIVVAP